jgi:hypothetical protein
MPPKKGLVAAPPNLYLYRIVTDTNAAPNVADGYLTLTICKQDIRRSAKVGDYVLALVAQSNEAMKLLKPSVEDAKFLAAYLFRVDETVDMKRYDAWCSIHAPHKLCTNDFFEGNAQYNENGKQRPGPHGKAYIEKNLSGCNSLVSTYFAAWTSRSPRRLTLEEFAAMGITEEKVNGLAQGYRKIPLPDKSMADFLIDNWRGTHHGSLVSAASAASASAAAANAGPAGAGAGPAAAPSAAAAASGSKGGKRKTRRNRHRRGSI